jgi:hypothetical protein
MLADRCDMLTRPVKAAMMLTCQGLAPKGEALDDADSLLPLVQRVEPQESEAPGDSSSVQMTAKKHSACAQNVHCRLCQRACVKV